MPPAAEHLQEIFDFIAADNPDAATRITRRIADAVDRVARMPYSGRPGKIPPTREIVISGTPYIVIYQIRKEMVEVLAIHHGARLWLAEL